MQKIYMGDAGPKVSPAVYGFYRWDEVKDAADVLKKQYIYAWIWALTPLNMVTAMAIINVKNCSEIY